MRRLRKHLADEQAVPPYVVFNDASLRQMAGVKPTTLDAFATINGVGAHKLERYGQTGDERLMIKRKGLINFPLCLQP